MDINNYIQEKEKQRQKDNYLSFSVAELTSLRADEVEHIIEFFHGYTLMRLPEEEIDFFNWLKKTDLAVWNDLWGDEIDTYLVSIDFLRKLVGENAGFPICDLIDEQNYWFTMRHVKPKGRERLEEILMKTDNNEALEISELFLFELAQQTTDIWHFCYRHHLDVEQMKLLISDMVFNGLLVHLPKREDLVKYIDF